MQQLIERASEPTNEIKPITEGLEVSDVTEVVEPVQDPQQSAEYRLNDIIFQLEEPGEMVNDEQKSQSTDMLVDSATNSESKPERAPLKESVKAIFRGFGRNARKAIIGARINLAVTTVKAKDTLDAANDTLSSVPGYAKDKLESAKDTAAELRETAKDRLNAAKKSIDSFGAPKRDPNDISDIVKVGKSGKTFHYETGQFLAKNYDPTTKQFDRSENAGGQFMQKEHIDLIRAHQDQIREGMRELNGTKEPNIFDNLKRNATERAKAIRSSAEDILFSTFDQIKDKKGEIQAGLVEQYTARKADVISEYRAAKEVIGDTLLDKVNTMNQYFADRKSEAEARKAARVESRKLARTERAKNREVDSRIVNAEVARRLESRERRTIEPAEARRRGRIATRAVSLSSGVRVDVAY